MTFWHRAIAIFLLMVFTPAAALAGTPFRYCVGDDGHRGIEFVLEKDHHATSEASVASAPDMAWKGEITKCTDRALFGGGYQSARAVLKDIEPSFTDVPPFLAATAIVLDRPSAIFEMVETPPVSLGITDPKIRARMTTVLLV